MSGGVDSSMSAYRLAHAGFDVVGVTMHLVPGPCSPDAAGVAAAIGIPHYMLNLVDQFEEKVIGPTRKEYARGRTPNPCVLCNRYMKFDALFQRADELGCTHVATGHYARIIEDSSGLHLLRGVDPEKDQSYFLSFLTEKDLARILFPLGSDEKSAVKEEAARIGLKVADRPESQDLCFLAAISEADFGVEPGDIVTTDGTVIGRHDGIGGFTIGQRKGVPGGMPKRMYVVGIDPDKNRVIVGSEDDLYSTDFMVEGVSLVSEERDNPRLKGDVEVQVRYRTRPVTGRVQLTGDGKGAVRLSAPFRAITPGQVAVFYDADEVLGAGTISSVQTSVGKTAKG